MFQNFQEEDMLMVYLPKKKREKEKKKKLPAGSYSNHDKKKNGPNQIIKKIGGNAYEIA